MIILFAEVSWLGSLNGWHSWDRELGPYLRKASPTQETKVLMAAVFLSGSTGVGWSLVTKDSPAFYLTALLGGQNILKGEKML